MAWQETEWVNVLVHNTTNFRFKTSDSSKYGTIIKLYMTTKKANVTLHLENNITNNNCLLSYPIYFIIREHSLTFIKCRN